MTEADGGRDGALQALVDGAAGAHQRPRPWLPPGVPGPPDLPSRPLEAEYALDGRFHRGPVPGEEVEVAGGQEVVPDAGGGVGAEVGVGEGVLHAPVPVRG